ncbi:ATP-binding protein [Streptomyces sp. BK239]|uniref:ATP-binding protein n=1 Tax=Streptomyces sp. BK239 TaxID=2512155 RepID=UPI0010EE02AD|nr:ATP-binding protein [Streptomyces sp. BK239]RZU18076.1 hypothetical protein EV567_2998 [Streptomyces sp. BK239]
MHTKGEGLRAWVTGLDDRAVRELLMIPGMLAHIPGIATTVKNTLTPRPRRREVLAARTWLSRAGAGSLTAIAQYASVWAVYRLERCYGHPAEQLSRPATDDLRQMLRDLDPVLAQITLYGILGSSIAADTSVEEHWDDLWAAATAAGSPCVCARGDGRCRPVGQGEDTSGADDEGVETDAVHGEEHKPLTMGISEEQLLAARQELSARSAELGPLLEEVLAQVRAGRAVSDLPAVRLEEWRQARSRIVDALAVDSRVWPEEAGFAELDAVVQELRDASAERAEELRRLDEDREGIRAVLDRTASDAPHRIHLQQSLSALEDRIRELLAAGAHAPAPPGGAPSDAAPDPDRATDSGADPVPTVETGPESALEAEPADAPVESGDSDPQPERETVPDAVSDAVSDPVSDAVSAAAPSLEAEPATAPTSDSPAAPAAQPVAAQELAPAPGAEDLPEADNLPERAATEPAPRAEESRAPLPERTGEGAPPPERPGEATPGTPATPTDTAAPDTGPKAAQKSRFTPWTSSATPGHGNREGNHDGDAVVARLIGQGRFQEAYWATVGSAEPAHRAGCLAFAEAAFTCDDEEEAAAVMTGFAPEIQSLQDDRPALVLAAVASLRAGLLVGWPNDLLIQADLSTAVPGNWGKLLERAVEALRRYHRLDLNTTRLTTDNTGLTPDLIASEAATLRDALRRQRIGYTRATQVRTRLIDSDQPLGKALEGVSAWAAGTAGAADLDQVWELFRKRGAAERMIEEADAQIRTPKQAKEPIEAAAKRALLRSIEQVSDLLSRARALAAPVVDERADSATGLRHALEQVRHETPPPGVEGAAVLRLRTWLLDGDRSRGATAPARDPDAVRVTDPPRTEALLAAPGLPRSAEGAPRPEEDGFAEAVLALLEPVDARAVLRRYLEQGDLHLADALVSALEQDLVPALPDGLDAVPRDWRQMRDPEWTRWSTVHRKAHTAASTLLAELRTQQLDMQTERELVGRLEELRRPAPEGAFGRACAGIAVLEAEIRAKVQEYVKRLREGLTALNPPEEELRRLASLLDAGDTVTAEECLALLREGKPLPDWSGTDSGAELKRFTAGIELASVRKSSGAQGYSARPWAESYLDGKPLTEGARSGLDSWDALCRPATRGSEWQRHIPSVLRVLGLECPQTPVRNQQREVRGVMRLTARARASESAPGYVAALGSAASAYTILVVSDEQRGRSPLELLDSSDSGACLILYLYPLGLNGRREMAARARTASSQQALVVDPAVFGWVAARSPRSFRATQRVTLPWTAYNPYTPFVAGLVPPEVFYGRQEEIAAVTDPLGALFLYGGRQLGKSALLRKVQASFPGSPGRKAIYVDLKARGVGEAEPAERIWAVLEDELKRVGVLEESADSAGVPDAMLAQVERWLDEGHDRRVLVLADEADAFLTADSKAVRGRGGEATFANVLRLKGLMDRTDRRFKIVFAGLHQVQRFSHLSNVPLTHGGPDVLISTLKPAEAQRLVVEPMAAFGYRFERPELVWRVLAATNYQACLVQMFCERLVATLRAKALASANWPITVTDEDVRSVTGSAQVHRHIAERLRITINLEDRYRVLALVIALRSQEDRYRYGYDADELLRAARERWREGFHSLTASDVRIYLDEMVGLGLLIQLADARRYAVRSPNVVSMLGTREDLELELRQTEFDLPYDYNPRFSRRFVGADGEGIARYSPLTEHQLHMVTAPGVAAVCLTEAHGPALVKHAVRSYSTARGLDFREAAVADPPQVLTEDADGRPFLMLADVRGRGPDAVAAWAKTLHAHTCAPEGGASHRTAVLLVDPAPLGHKDELITCVVRPERWTPDSLRAWPECPFDTPDKRRQVIELTGGWPHLLERTVHRITREGSTLEAALEAARGFVGQRDFARVHLERVGLDPGLTEVLTEWSQYVEPGEGCTYTDIASVTGMRLDDVRTLVGRLLDHGVLDDGPEGCSLDRITFRALQVLSEPS